jgi:hypothetical protein
LADELRTLYPQFQQKIADLFARIATNDKQIIDLHGRCPVGVPQRLHGAELKARNLAVFDSYTKSLAKTLQLPAWHADEPMAWPPPQPSMAERYLATMPTPIFDEHYSGDWWRAIERDDEERRKITRRRQEEEEQRQLESRRAYEASLRRGVSHRP